MAVHYDRATLRDARDRGHAPFCIKLGSFHEYQGTLAKDQIPLFMEFIQGLEAMNKDYAAAQAEYYSTQREEQMLITGIGESITAGRPDDAPPPPPPPPPPPAPAEAPAKKTKPKPAAKRKPARR